MKITLDSTVEKKANLLTTSLDKRIVAMNIEDGDYYSFNDIASLILKMIEKPKRVMDLCNDLVRKFEVSEQQCHKDVLTLLEKLNDASFLNVY